MQYQILLRYHYRAGTLLVLQFPHRAWADAAFRQLEKEGSRYLTALKLYEPEEEEGKGEVINVI